MNTTKRSGMRWAIVGAGLVCAMATISCVSEQQYNDAVNGYQREQDEKFAAQKEMERLKSENTALKSELRSDKGKALAAAWNDDVQKKMSDLQRMLEERQSQAPLKDIERFDIPGVGYVFMIQDKVLFSSGSADISEEGKKSLKGLADQINASQHGSVVVRGHTDNDPVVKQSTKERFPMGNLQLSAERAVSVAAFMIDSKIPPSQVVIAGYGEWQPVADNNSADNKRLNRRVEIFVADQ